MRSEKVTLYADYCEWPLWAPIGNLSEDAVPLSPSLNLRIKAWFNAYDDAPHPDWPLWEPPGGLSTDEIEQAWVDEGEEIRRTMEHELGYAVGYET